jgi:sulfur carrier protein
MRVIVNGREQELAEGVTVAGLVEQLRESPDGRGVAVAVDAEVVPRSRWDSTRLTEGQRVELVAAIQGG